MKKFFVMLPLLLISAAFISAQEEQPELPDWIDKDPYIEDGIIYSVGYAKFGVLSMSLNAAQQRAKANILSLPELHTTPAPAEKSEEISSNINGRKINAVIYGVTVVDRFITDDQGAYVLISCTGVEIKDQE
jgi:hypothetical protein